MIRIVVIFSKNRHDNNTKPLGLIQRTSTSRNQ